MPGLRLQVPTDGKGFKERELKDVDVCVKSVRVQLTGAVGVRLLEQLVHNISTFKHDFPRRGVVLCLVTARTVILTF